MSGTKSNLSHSLRIKLTALLCLTIFSTCKASFVLSQNSAKNSLFHRKDAAARSSQKPSPSPLTIMRPLLNVPPGGGSYTHLKAVLPLHNAAFMQASKIYCLANGVGFVLSLLTKSHAHVDLIGTGAFAAASVGGITSSIQRVQLSSLFVTVWGTKLASFLFFRALRLGHDGRLDDTLSNFSGTLGFWIVSALWGLVCSLPHTLGTTSTLPGSNWALILGSAMFVVGCTTETLADYQKWMFKQSNPGKFCNVGLWSISQHPNFFGNLLLWTGILVLNAPALVDPQVAEIESIWHTLWRFKKLFLAALSPLFMAVLFYTQATGALTNAVELSNARYGDNPEYKKYITTVPLIIPTLSSIFQK